MRDGFLSLTLPLLLRVRNAWRVWKTRDRRNPGWRQREMERGLEAQAENVFWEGGGGRGWPQDSSSSGDTLTLPFSIDWDASSFGKKKRMYRQNLTSSHSFILFTVFFLREKKNCPSLHTELFLTESSLFFLSLLRWHLIDEFNPILLVNFEVEPRASILIFFSRLTHRKQREREGIESLSCSVFALSCLLGVYLPQETRTVLSLSFAMDQAWSIVKLGTNTFSCTCLSIKRESITKRHKFKETLQYLLCWK